MKNEFILALNEVLEEKQLPKEIVLEALEAAMVSAYRRAVNASSAQHVEARIDHDTGKVAIFAEKEVVDSVQDDRTEVILKEAKQVDPNAEIGGMVIVESTPQDFGRVAAQTARQVIQQRIREAERDSQMKHYTKQVGEIVSGIVQAITAQGITLGLDMKAEGILPRNQQVPGERFRVHDRVQALLLEVKQTPRGPQIILSRSHRNFLRRLLENEVPEIYHGLVEIRSISREPGQRSKVAVSALQPAVDPVGACVGIRGVRIQAIVRELNDEKIDVIEYDTDPAVYIAKALSPARVNGVYLNELAKGAKTATVVVPEDQLSLAIGRDGQNARLAAKLTSWRIDIKSLVEASTDALHKLQTDSEYAFLAAREMEIIPRIEAILAKKAEGRPVTPEEYQQLSQLVDRVERGLIHRRSAEKRAEEEHRKAVRATVPEHAFTLALEDIELSDRVYALLTEADYRTVGDVKLQLALNQDVIFGLPGVGPKAMEEINRVIGAMEFPEPVVIEEEEPVLAEVVEEVILPPADTLVEEIAVPVEEIPVDQIELQPEQVEPVVLPVPEVELHEELPAGLDELSQMEPERRETQPEEISMEPVELVSEEVPESLDDLFKLRPDDIDLSEIEDEESEEDLDKKKKKKKKKKKFVEVEYDPDQDVVVVHRKRKRGGDWEENWDY
jgi:N utilization substance protein A